MSGEDWVKVLAASTAIAAVVVGFFGLINMVWLSKRTRLANEDLEKFKQEAARKLEEYKSEVSLEIQDGLQRAKYQLEQERIVHEVKFKEVYGDVARVLKCTFRLLSRLHVSGWVLIDLVGDAKQEIVESALEEFREHNRQINRYVRDRQIYLPKTTFGLVIGYSRKLQGTATKFMAARNQDKNTNDYSIRLMDAQDALNKVLDPLYQELCFEIRDSLGLAEKPEVPTKAVSGPLSPA